MANIQIILLCKMCNEVFNDGKLNINGPSAHTCKSSILNKGSYKFKINIEKVYVTYEKILFKLESLTVLH